MRSHTRRLTGVVTLLILGPAWTCARTRHWRRRTDEYGSRRRAGTDKRGAFYGRPLPRVALETDCRGSVAGPPDSQQRNAHRTGARLSLAGIRAPGAGAFDVFAVRAWRLRLVHAHRRADDWTAVDRFDHVTPRWARTPVSEPRCAWAGTPRFTPTTATRSSGLALRIRSLPTRLPAQSANPT